MKNSLSFSENLTMVINGEKSLSDSEDMTKNSPLALKYELRKILHRAREHDKKFSVWLKLQITKERKFRKGNII